MRVFDWLGRELLGAQLRRPFRLSPQGLVNEWLRAVSYSAAIVATLLFGPSAGRTHAMVALATPVLVNALIGIRLRGERAQAPNAMADLVVAPILVAITTSSPLLAGLTAWFVAGLIAITFAIDFRVVAAGVGVSLLGIFGATSALGTEGSSNLLFGLASISAMSISITLVVAFAGWWKGHRKLQRKGAELDTLLEATPVMVATVDRHARLLSLMGHVPDATWREGGRVPALLRPLVDGALEGSTVSADMMVTDRWFAFTGKPTPEGVTITGFDVTDREAARASLEDLVATKDRFVASISHELRTPLTAVLGFAEQLRSSSGLVGDDREYLELIATQSAEMAAIIEDLLVVVRADLDLISVVERPIDLAIEAEAVCRSLSPRLGRPVFLDLGEAKAGADPTRVRQIVRNLLTNADHYGGERLVVSARTSDGRALLEVRDDGPPIPLDRAERMFQPYESEGRDSAVPAAIGLGLAVSRRLAELMAGTLTYRHDGEWGIFRLSLPALD